MSDERIAPEVIAAAVAAKAAHIEANPMCFEENWMEAAIRAALDELGLKEEWSVVHEDGRRQETNKNSALTLTFHPSGRRMESRLVWDWRPVERPS